jgi:hypothetical protein
MRGRGAVYVRCDALLDLRDFGRSHRRAVRRIRRAPLWLHAVSTNTLTTNPNEPALEIMLSPNELPKRKFYRIVRVRAQAHNDEELLKYWRESLIVV